MDVNQLAYELGHNDSQVALKQLYLYFYPRLLLFASYYVKSKEICEEIVSDAFIIVWEKRKQLSDIQNLNSYIYTITKNLAIDYLRKNGNQINVDISEIDYIFRNQSDPEEELISSELMDKLDLAVESLPERCKMVFKLIRNHNLKQEEVTKILQISKKTLEGHMTSAIKRLIAVLNKHIQ